MELLFGTHVREYGQHVGRLAGFEIDPATQHVRTIIFSSDGSIGNHAMTRPFASVLAEPGEIDIRPYTAPADVARTEGIVLGPAARVVRDGREAGRVSGIEAAIGTGAIESVIGRRGWWTRRFRIDGHGIDLSVPGEVRARGAASQAA